MRFISSCVVALFVIFLSIIVSPVFAQQKIHQSTSLPPDARFEIIQSPLAAKWTFRLDRFTGRVFQLVKTQEDGVAWQPMPNSRSPQLSNPMKPRFVIFTSGLAARHTFLVDSYTGQTWILKLFLGIVGWQPFKE